LLVAAVAVAAASASGRATTQAQAAAAFTPCGPHRFVRDRPEPKRWLRAFFVRRSYAPGESAQLVVARRSPTPMTVQIFHADAGPAPPKTADLMTGVAVTRPSAVRSGTVIVRIGRWQSGLYYARLSALGWLGFAPLIVRAAVPGENRVAVVLPTNTWQAYNFLDENHSGYGDTWYADPRVRTVRFDRPFLDRGVPPHLGRFPYWLWLNRRNADYLSDDDLERFASAGELARLYRLIVFAGHEEYVTSRVFSLILGYRNHGGNLAFLSANSLYSRVVRRGDAISCVGHFRDEGKPEAALVGVQYLDWNHNVFRNEPYRVVGAARARWFFRGTRLKNGRRFGFAYGVEIDAVAPASPRDIQVLAELPNIFGPGRTAEMTYYVGPRQSEVFAAGAMNFDSSQSPVTDRLLSNLWEHLTQSPRAGAPRKGRSRRRCRQVRRLPFCVPR
jgi:hypothetical protein